MNDCSVTGVVEAGTKEPGLLVVDLQSGFSPEPELVAEIALQCRKERTIVLTRFVNPPNSLFRKVLNWHDDGGALLLSPAKATILEKTGYGLTAEHIQTLRGLGCSTWEICGVETDACVIAVAFSLWDAGLRPIIRYDLCSSPMHEVGVVVGERQFGSRPRFAA